MVGLERAFSKMTFSWLPNPDVPMLGRTHPDNTPQGWEFWRGAIRASSALRLPQPAHWEVPHASDITQEAQGGRQEKEAGYRLLAVGHIEPI